MMGQLCSGPARNDHHHWRKRREAPTSTLASRFSYQVLLWPRRPTVHRRQWPREAEAGQGRRGGGRRRSGRRRRPRRAIHFRDLIFKFRPPATPSKWPANGHWQAGASPMPGPHQEGRPRWLAATRARQVVAVELMDVLWAAARRGSSPTTPKRRWRPANTTTTLI